MKLPPIPPNCKLFEQRFGFLEEMVFHHDRNRNSKFIRWLLHGPLHPDMRTIIASVARCAWLDFKREAPHQVGGVELIGDAAHLINDGSCKIPVMSKSLYDFEMAEAYAEAWRLWGDGKPWGDN